LKYNEGFLANYLTTWKFLDENCSSKEGAVAKLKYHLAKKKIDFYCSKEKKIVEDTGKNGNKFELFIFDIFE